MPYFSNTESLHSCSPSSVPFTVDCENDIHAPLFCPGWRRRSSAGESHPTAAVRDSSTSCAFHLQISTRPSISICLWYPYLNSTWPWRAATVCPVTMHGTDQFPCDFWVGSGISSPACLTRNPMIVRPGMCVSAHRKRGGSNSSQRDFSTGRKSSPSLWVAHCTKTHSCLRDF